MKDYEKKVLELFRSQDKTIMNINRIYTYTSEDGETSVATNGHCILLRRSGSHTKMRYDEIAKLPHDQGAEKPFPWDIVLKFDAFPSTDPQYDKRSISPVYFSWLAKIEEAEGKRRAEDYMPSAGESAKTQKKSRANLKNGAVLSMQIPTDPFAGWHFKINGSVEWHAVIMPRRP